METYLQIILGICLVILFFVIGFAIYNYEFLKSLRKSGGIQEKTVIFEGVKDFSTTRDETYNTVDKNASNYRNIGPSYNQMGGIEFTYNFWLFVDNGQVYPSSGSGAIARRDLRKRVIPDEGYTYDNIQSQTILFTKGSKVLSRDVNSMCGTCDRTTTPKTNCKDDIQIKCPLVKLENYGQNITVEFNTIQGKEAVRQNTPNVCNEVSSNWITANAHKITLGNINRSEFDQKWIMVTIILQDTYPTDPIPYRNKVHARIFINNLLELDTYVDGSLTPGSTDFSTIKTNDGFLYVAPYDQITASDTSSPPNTRNLTLPQNGSTQKLMMADLTYYNYAIDQPTIESLFDKGPSSKIATRPGEADKISTTTAARSKQSMTDTLHY
jgi:hypothetical protein